MELFCASWANYGKTFPWVLAKHENTFRESYVVTFLRQYRTWVREQSKHLFWRSLRNPLLSFRSSQVTPSRKRHFAPSLLQDYCLSPAYLKQWLLPGILDNHRKCSHLVEALLLNIFKTDIAAEDSQTMRGRLHYTIWTKSRNMHLRRSPGLFTIGYFITSCKACQHYALKMLLYQLICFSKYACVRQ